MGTRKAVTPPLFTIRAMREFAGLALDDLARRITTAGYPITKSGLGNIETGVRGPSAEFLEALTLALNDYAAAHTGGRVTEVARTIDRDPRAARRSD
jgi:transcriptional regulator with XRE-family HTH domain